MKTPIRTLFCLLTLFFAGCLPEERFWWSPDGSRAVVAVASQIYLVTTDGSLKATLSDDLKIEGDLPRHVSWLPDGSGFVLSRTIKRNTWDEFRALLPADEVNEIERFSMGMPGFLSAALAMSGDKKLAESLLELTPNHDKELLAAAFFCALAKNRAAVESALRDSLKGSEFLAEVGGQSDGFGVYEICLVRLKKDQLDGEPAALVRSVHPVFLPSVSPKFPAVAFWHVLSDEKHIGLAVCTLDGKQRIEVAGTNNTTLDWTADGRSVVFAAPVADEDVMFQNIRKVAVVQESGSLMETLEPIDLAVAIVTNPACLCALPDGRVLFSSQPAKLPAPSDGMKLAPRLHVISADGKSVDAVPTAPGDLPTNLSYFVASPDGKRVAVVESDTDAVAVVELATGKTEIVSPAHPNWRCRTMPAWKSATELTFAALSTPASSPKWMLWKQGAGVRSISDQWPAEATNGWLEEKKESPKSGP
jgi:hypothetical protein